MSAKPRASRKAATAKTAWQRVDPSTQGGKAILEAMQQAVTDAERAARPTEAETMKGLLRTAIDTINHLRQANEVLYAKVETMELLGRMLDAESRRPGRPMTVDVAWQLQQKLEEMDAATPTKDPPA